MEIGAKWLSDLIDLCKICTRIVTRSRFVRWLRRTNQKCIRHFAALLYYLSIIIIIAGIVCFFYTKKHPEEADKIIGKTCTTDDILDASQAVVLIQGKNSAGTGFWIDDNSIITNNHVVDHNDELKAWDHAGNYIPVTLVATDTIRDVALLRTATFYTGPKIKWSDGQNNLAEDVYALGYPGGTKFSISKGIISSVVKDDYDDRTYIQTDATINPGNSGGPLVDQCGKILGLNTSAMFDGNIGFSFIASQVQDRIVALKDQASKSNDAEIASTYPSDKVEIVAKYYSTLSKGYSYLDEAYNYFSQKRKSRLPLENWKNEIQGTAFINIKSMEQVGNTDVVKVDFLASDYDLGTWNIVTKEFTGTWSLVREDGLWKMNESNIKEVTTPPVS